MDYTTGTYSSAVMQIHLQLVAVMVPYTSHTEYDGGILCAITAKGMLKWKYGGTKSWIISDPAIGSDGTIYFESGDNKLYV